MKKKTLIKFLFNKGFIKKEDNLYYAEKAFKAKMLVNACFGKKDPKILKKYIIILENFLSGDIDFQLKDGKIFIKDISNKELVPDKQEQG
tara:strand:+ start:340 stop:609 length:270 start_codon:yes stop_codon:yes gene_type:complete